jgi:hypothetical protein
MAKKQAKPKKTKSSKPVTLKKVKGSNGNSRLAWLLASVAIAALCFFPMLSNGFTNWDDESYVIKNALLRGPDWPGIFSQEVVGNYHPLTIATLAINYQLTGLEASSYLLTNYFLHLINIALVFQFVYLISDSKTKVAFFVALIFGIHPMHVESVVWIAERKDVLYTFFFLLSLIKYLHYLQSGKKINYWLCFLFFLLSLFSKPAAIVLPLVLLLLDYWKGRTISGKVIIEKIPFFIFSLLLALITLKIQSTTAIVKLDSYPLWTRPLLGCYSIMIYFFRFFIPYPLSTLHPFPKTDHLEWPYLISPIFIIAFLFFLWYQRKNRLIIFSVLFFIVNLLLIIHIISIGSSVVSERYTYVPYIGISFMFGMWLSRYKNPVSEYIYWAAVSLITVVFGYITFQRIGIWKDSTTLWTNVINQYPDAPLPRTNLANYNIVLAGDPAYSNQSKALYQQALDDCNAALLNKPDDEQALANRQNIYLNLIQDSLAFADAEKLIKLYPNNKSGYYTRGAVYNRANQPDKALADLNKCLSLDATIDWGFSYRASILFNSFKRYAEALSDYNKAIELNPQANHYLNRSYCYYYLGDHIKAKRDAQTAVAMGATIPDDYRKAINF